MRKFFSILGKILSFGIILVLGYLLLNWLQERTPNYTVEDMGIANHDFPQRGVYIDYELSLGNEQAFIISMGERPTFGYSISLASITINEDGEALVIVRETSPAEDLTHDNTIIYPALRIIFHQAPSSVTFKNTDDVGFEFID